MVVFVGLLRFAGPSEALDSRFTSGAQREDHYCVSFHSYSQMTLKRCTILLAFVCDLDVSLQAFAS